MQQTWNKVRSPPLHVYGKSPQSLCGLAPASEALAQKLQDPAAKSFMSDIAERYDRLASRAESDAGLATAIRHFDNR